MTDRWLGDKAPVAATNDALDRSGRYLVAHAEGAIGPATVSIQPTDITHVGLAQACVWMLFAPRDGSGDAASLLGPSCLAPLRHLIGGIFGASTQEQMARIAAGGIIASMQHAQPRWDLVASEEPGSTRCCHLLTVNRQIAISAGGGPDTLPAVIGATTLNLCGQALGGRRTVVMVRRILAGLPAYIASFGLRVPRWSRTLTTAALAVSCGNSAIMPLHRNQPFRCRGLGLLTQLRGYLLAYYRLDIRRGAS